MRHLSNWHGALPWLSAAMIVALVASVVVADAVGEDVKQAVPKAVVVRFAKLDRNGDQKLELDEFKAAVAPAQAAVSLRDFNLFDLDANGSLSLNEYWSLPTHPTDQRGPLPDPLTEVVNQFMGILDQLFQNWDKDPRRTIPVARFLGEFSRTLQEPLTAQMSQEADPDLDQQVTREEARRFVEIQAGVRRSDGKLLREPNGRVVQYMQFQFADRDRNDQIDRAELLAYAGEKDAALILQKVDTDQDQIVSWDEWSRHRMQDTVLDFRYMDVNLDGRLDKAELLQGTPRWIKISAELAFPSFDTDRSGALSLAEYRLTMHSLPVARWHDVIVDDGDGRISRTEFRYAGAVPVLRYVYFGLLDRNSDGELDPDEFRFKRKIPREFYSMNADGTGWKKLFGVASFPSLGSPAVSPDGRQIAFDGHGLKKGLSEQTLLITDFDGGHLRNLGLGMMPTWSKDGSQLSYSKGGIQVVNADGTKSRSLANGWGAQWSPDGKRIAYYSGLQLMTLDVATEKTTAIYDAKENQYRQIYWNMTWSPDSRRICFKGTKVDGSEEIASVDADPAAPRLKVHYAGKGIATDFAWHPVGNRLIFCMHCPQRAVTQLYEFNPNTEDPPQLVKGQDPNSANNSVCWTPDGKQLIVITGDE